MNALRLQHLQMIQESFCRDDIREQIAISCICFATPDIPSDFPTIDGLSSEDAAGPKKVMN
jgi:hypothetical protein